MLLIFCYLQLRQYKIINLLQALAVSSFPGDKLPTVWGS
jgi:hypothetical protein